jgi:hypothetical protein
MGRSRPPKKEHHRARACGKSPKRWNSLLKDLGLGVEQRGEPVHQPVKRRPAQQRVWALASTLQIEDPYLSRRDAIKEARRRLRST